MMDQEWRERHLAQERVKLVEKLEAAGVDPLTTAVRVSAIEEILSDLERQGYGYGHSLNEDGSVLSVSLISYSNPRRPTLMGQRFYDLRSWPWIGLSFHCAATAR